MNERDRSVVSVVDDDESLRRSLRNLLRSVGLGVETFASAEEFVRSGQRESTGCLVLDLRMTGMSGLDLLRHLAIEDAHIPVVMLTAHGDEATRRRSLRAGAVAFLDKPFRSDALLDAVRAALGERGAAPMVADVREGGHGHEC
jgi:two-component system response regulator FixJ